MRAELRMLRKEHLPAVGKMPKHDVAAEIQRYKVATEETPLVAATKSSREVPKTVPTATAQDATFQKVGGTSKGMPRKTARPAYEDLPEKKAAPKAAPKKGAQEPEKTVPAKKGRPAKGSPEAKAHMDRIRAMRGKKKE